MQRFVVSEYGVEKNIIDLALQLKLSETELMVLLRNANIQLRRYLKLNADVIYYSNRGFTIKGVAGIFKISSNLEMEVVPKFLGVNEITWKDDFLELLFLTNSGNILYSEHIIGGINSKKSLYDILAKEFIKMFNYNKKYYIRRYKKRTFYEFGIEGEPDYERIYERTPDGIRQYQTLFDKKNVYNAIISKAATIIRSKVKSTDNINGLTAIISYLGPQNDKMPSYKVPLKSRDGRWKQLYDTSYEIVKNMSFSYVESKVSYNAPGFVFSTWQVWQKLIEYSLTVGLKQYKVVAQMQCHFGNRIFLPSLAQENVDVFPDITIFNKNMDMPLLLVDAKYKGRFEKDQFSISSSDVYEAFAFCKAAGCKRIILLYPKTTDSKMEVGETIDFTKVTIEDIEIYGLKIEMLGLSSNGGIKKFIYKLAISVLKYIN